MVYDPLRAYQPSAFALHLVALTLISRSLFELDVHLPISWCQIYTLKLVRPIKVYHGRVSHGFLIMN